VRAARWVSRVEQTLLEGGRGAAVIHQRMEFQELMRERFAAVIERTTSRRVIGFMSGNQQQSYTQKLWMRVKRKAAYLPG